MKRIACTTTAAETIAIVERVESAELLKELYPAIQKHSNKNLNR